MTATGQDSRQHSRFRPNPGMVNSSISPQSPPLLSIEGQNYTTDKIKRVVRPDHVA